MKHIFSTLLFFTILLPAIAQSGPGHEFSYGPGGYRVKREYKCCLVYLIQSKEDNQVADTILGYFQKEDPTASILEQDYIVKAYPNPVHDILFVENLSWKEGDAAEFRLMDITGKQILIKRSAQPKEKIEFNQSVAPGTYQMSYYLNGAFIISWQIVKI